ncbi:hypothetical protein BS47DRAFT_1386309 [Hydnum rufescens UP504]|uniref:Uncharacterized protein n=1 Tax=Hydnum rufescens UP504 TaxID=1448309 RepID=A0A9P6AFM6_9AGAM|nr:hypothetical protein BS47DRAFT_1386309 [Hydnum rufescens UP504]
MATKFHPDLGPQVWRLQKVRKVLGEFIHIHGGNTVTDKLIPTLATRASRASCKHFTLPQPSSRQVSTCQQESFVSPSIITNALLYASTPRLALARAGLDPLRGHIAIFALEPKLHFVATRPHELCSVRAWSLGGEGMAVLRHGGLARWEGIAVFERVDGGAMSQSPCALYDVQLESSSLEGAVEAATELAWLIQDFTSAKSHAHKAWAESPSIGCSIRGKSVAQPPVYNPDPALARCEGHGNDSAKADIKFEEKATAIERIDSESNDTPGFLSTLI